MIFDNLWGYKRMRKIVLSIFSLLIIVSLSGCATIFGVHHRSVRVTSNKPGAKVYYDGDEVGRTPVTFNVANPAFHPGKITVKKSGYDPQTKQVMTLFQAVGVLNVLFPPGFLVDAISGDMMKVNPTAMHFNLIR